jgi:hypothetical protein
MANVIDNTIMNYSILWPKGAEGVAHQAPADNAAGPAGGRSSVFVGPLNATKGTGWLKAGMGQNVDLLA